MLFILGLWTSARCDQFDFALVFWYKVHHLYLVNNYEVSLLSSVDSNYMYTHKSKGRDIVLNSKHTLCTHQLFNS